MKMMTMAAMATAALTATAAFAHDYTVGDLIIAHPMSFETAVTAQTGAGYLEITNTGDIDDRLLEARADFPRVEVHEIVEVDDVMSMQHLTDGLVIPAGQTVTLEPGGYHIMLMGLSAPFVVGDEYPLTLVFEHAGEIEVMMQVEVRMAETEMDHGDMDMDAEEASE